jgi:endonuclease YncB( thermonuclease family)
MNPVISFWKKDIINKLIVIILLLLVGGVFGIGWLIINMPQGKSFSGAFANFLPEQVTPTFDLNTYLTPGATIRAFTTSTIEPIAQPAFTLPPLTTIVELPTSTPELFSIPSVEMSKQSLEAETQPASNRSNCIPNNPPRTGKVVEVIDGNTVRVLLVDTGLVYVVRYIGISVPVDKVLGEKAKQKNSGIVYGQEVVLIQDKVDKDDRGRLLRYVLAGNTFVNNELLQQGFGLAIDNPPDLACAQEFKQAEQAARAAMIGFWSPIATPKSP